MTCPKRPPRRVVKIVSSTYQPTKSDMEEEIRLPKMSLEEASRRVLEPVEVRHIPRPNRRR